MTCSLRNVTSGLEERPEENNSHFTYPVASVMLNLCSQCKTMMSLFLHSAWKSILLLALDVIW